MIRFSFVLATLAAAALLSPSVSAETRITAPKTDVRVIDGDTIEIKGKVIDIYGMDAPELGQLCLHKNDLWSCGIDAAFALQKLVGEGAGVVKCSYWGAKPKSGKESTAVCESAGRDVARTMIFNGFAVAPPGAFPMYPDTQDKARKTGLGIWRGRFILPWDWRIGIRLGEETTNDEKGCPVKSVIGREGKRVHFVPTDKAYKETAVDITAGGRCFATDEEARLAEAPPPPPPKKARRVKRRTRRDRSN